MATGPVRLTVLIPVVLPVVGACASDLSGFTVGEEGPDGGDAPDAARADGRADGSDAAAADAARSTDAAMVDAQSTDAGAVDGASDGRASGDGSAVDATSDAGPDASACEPQCVVGGMCGADDGCGGACLGRCDDDYEQVCHGGICNEQSWCPQAACDLAESVGCTVGSSCYTVRGTDGSIDDIACLSPGGVPAGGACAEDSECVPGHGCVVGKCRRYCCRPASMPFTPSSEYCPDFCERFTGTVGYCVELCNPRDPDSCALDQVCVVSRDHAGITYCIETIANPRGEGEVCEFANECAHGFFCTGTCERLCDPEAETPCPEPTDACTTVQATAGVSVCRAAS